MFAELSKIAIVHLGYKSLQNAFFYINEATIDTFGIERRYLTPILKLRDIDARTYRQALKPALWLFCCRDAKTDLRGTGALRYIEAMADRSAAAKKQTGKNQTIREALEAQAGRLWYAPKARPNKKHIWLRKAFDGVFAPFLFDKPAVVDQRCNSVTPLQDVKWKEVAAVFTSSLFAYSLEINGAASMGAGALEVPTTKLSAFPVLDITRLKPRERMSLVVLAQAVWENETPVDWSQSDASPGARLRALDQWMIEAARRDVKIDVIYADIADACQSRIRVANDKRKMTKKKQAENVGNVADSIVRAIMPKMQTKKFPDDFVDSADLDFDISFNVPQHGLKQIFIAPLLDSYDIEVIAKDGSKVYEGAFPRSVAEAIVRSLLWGRRVFAVSSNRKAMGKAVTRFLGWVSEIETDIADSISESSLGTGYEDALKREVYARLGIHPLSGVKTLPPGITFHP